MSWLPRLEALKVAMGPLGSSVVAAARGIGVPKPL